MKFSQYNSVIPLTVKDSLLFNAITNKYIIFSSSMMNKLVDDEIDYIYQNSPDLYSKLIEAECLIEDRVDELQLLKNNSSLINNNKHEFILIINPTLDCNFRCWYCYEHHMKNSQMDDDTIRSVKKFMAQQISSTEIERFYLSFFGGEPLLKFFEVIVPILEYAQEKCDEEGKELHIGMTTNGALVSEDIIRTLKKYRISGLQITLDGCKEDHNKVRNAGKGRDSYEIILNNIRKLLKNQIPVILRINYTSLNVRKSIMIKDDLVDLTNEMKSRLSISLHRIWQDRDNSNKDIDSFVEHEIENITYAFRDEGFNVSFRFNDNIKMSCYGDKVNEAVINYNGDVFKCTARDFSSKNRYGYLNEFGEIVWDKKLLEDRQNTRFTNTSCLKCRIAPICAGGCSQVLVENIDSEYCLCDNDNEKKDQVVLNNFNNQFIL